MSQNTINENDPQKLDELFAIIKPRLSILDVVSQYVSLEKRGHNYWGICPFHSCKEATMVVMPSQNIYKCFECGVGGDVLNFLVRIKKSSYKDVILELAEKFGIDY